MRFWGEFRLNLRGPVTCHRLTFLSFLVVLIVMWTTVSPLTSLSVLMFPYFASPLISIFCLLGDSLRLLDESFASTTGMSGSLVSVFPAFGLVFQGARAMLSSFVGLLEPVRSLFQFSTFRTLPFPLAFVFVFLAPSSSNLALSHSACVSNFTNAVLLFLLKQIDAVVGRAFPGSRKSVARSPMFIPKTFLITRVLISLSLYGVRS